MRDDDHLRSANFVATTKTTLRRKPDRGTYPRRTAYAILDEGFVAHVGISVKDQPLVIPMAYGRDQDRLLLHGSVASRLLRSLDQGIPVCVTVTLIDGIGLATSQRLHSLNYRSVVIFGTARRIQDSVEAAHGLARLVGHIVPGRSDETRLANNVEAQETMLLELPTEEASVKIRSGGPFLEQDCEAHLGIWAGVLPITLTPGQPVTAEFTPANLKPPASISPWRRPQGNT